MSLCLGPNLDEDSSGGSFKVWNREDPVEIPIRCDARCSSKRSFNQLKSLKMADPDQFRGRGLEDGDQRRRWRINFKMTRSPNLRQWAAMIVTSESMTVLVLGSPPDGVVLRLLDSRESKGSVTVRHRVRTGKLNPLLPSTRLPALVPGEARRPRSPGCFGD
eukprot:superscaffoldBa00000008_g179